MPYASLSAGDPAPWFRQRTVGYEDYAFDSVAGRYVVLCFFGSASDAHSQALISAVGDRGDLFDDDFASFFGVTGDPTDEAEKRVVERYPGYRFFLDFDLTASRLYGAVDKSMEAGVGHGDIRRLWLVLDPTLRIMKVIRFRDDRSDIAEVLDFVGALKSPHQFAGFEIQAPILILPQVFEPDFCALLIDMYRTGGGTESGFMRDIDGKTAGVTDHAHKRRKDYQIEDEDIIAATKSRISRRIAPEIRKAHQFEVTRMERYLVACYSSEDGGHFGAHRDNTTIGTAHRRFAVSINLNDDFDGGEVCFPEYGPRSFKAPAGGAVVFSCSLLHAVSQVTRGSRYAFLPFLYDEVAAGIREENNKYLSEGVGKYQREGQG